jgi:uncharacterized DUF497 family protein
MREKIEPTSESTGLISPMLPKCSKDRFIAFGLVQSRLMAVVYAERGPDIIRIISFRKANHREKALFKKTIKDRLGQG